MYAGADGQVAAVDVYRGDPVESPRWAWRDEKGNDVGIARVVGQRRYLKDQ